MVEYITYHDKLDYPSTTISIIIPIYNAEAYLAHCLDSVISQTFQDFEVICINDGSTDNSISILQKYASKDSRIKIIEQKNYGTSIAKNNGIATAIGKYIYPLDSDDKIAPTCLEELYKIITTTDCAAICSDGIFFGEKSGKWNLPKLSRRNMYSWNIGIYNSALYDKKYWVEYEGYSKELTYLGNEDFDFWLNFIDNGKKLVRIHKPLFYYRIKPAVESRNRHSTSKTTLKICRQILFAKHPKLRLYYYIYRKPQDFFINIIHIFQKIIHRIYGMHCYTNIRKRLKTPFCGISK
jgi:glycosyltransferase involved in cell wall biosynthesis